RARRPREAVGRKGRDPPPRPFRFRHPDATAEDLRDPAVVVTTLPGRRTSSAPISVRLSTYVLARPAIPIATPEPNGSTTRSGRSMPPGPPTQGVQLVFANASEAPSHFACWRRIASTKPAERVCSPTTTWPGCTRSSRGTPPEPP